MFSLGALGHPLDARDVAAQPDHGGSTMVSTPIALSVEFIDGGPFARFVAPPPGSWR